MTDDSQYYTRFNDLKHKLRDDYGFVGTVVVTKNAVTTSSGFNGIPNPLGVGGFLFIDEKAANQFLDGAPPKSIGLPFAVKEAKGSEVIGIATFGAMYEALAVLNATAAATSQTPAGMAIGSLSSAMWAMLFPAILREGAIATGHEVSKGTSFTTDNPEKLLKFLKTCERQYYKLAGEGGMIDRWTLEGSKSEQERVESIKRTIHSSGSN